LVGTGFVGEEGASGLRVPPPEVDFSGWPKEVRREKFTPAGPTVARVVPIQSFDLRSLMFDGIPTSPLWVGLNGDEVIRWRLVGSQDYFVGIPALGCESEKTYQYQSLRSRKRFPDVDFDEFPVLE
jgi:hypothetical protein